MAVKGTGTIRTETESIIETNISKDISGDEVQVQIVDALDSLSQGLYDNTIPYEAGESKIFEVDGVKTLYLCLAGTTPGESPSTTPAKWEEVPIIKNNSIKSIDGLTDSTSLWLTNDKSQYYAGYTYFVYNDYSDNTRRIIKYNNNSKEWSSPVTLTTTSYVGGGNVDGQDYAHAAPSIFIDSGGYINLFYAGYKQGNVYNIRSSNSADISSWDSEVLAVSGGTTTAYPTLIEVGGDFVLFYRTFNVVPILARKVSVNEGSTWGTELQINDYYPYYVVRVDSNDRIHLAWHERTAVDEDLFYAYSDDIKVASPTLYDAADASQTLPLVNTVCKVFDSSISWDGFYLLGMDVDVNDKPHLIGLAYDAINTDELMHFEYTSGWNSTTILVSNNIKNDAYVALVAEGDVKCIGEEVYCMFCIKDIVYELHEYKSPNNGGAWIKDNDITSNSTTNNTNPCYVIGEKSSISKIWFSGTNHYQTGKNVYFK